MGFDVPLDDEYNVGSSKFNEAAYRMKRIHELQSVINLASQNPKAWNLELNCYNYEVIFNSLKSLLATIWGKLDDKERAAIGFIRGAIQNQLASDELKPHQTIHFADKKTRIICNENNYKMLETAMEIFRLNIEDLMTAHQIDNPPKMIDEGL